MRSETLQIKFLKEEKERLKKASEMLSMKMGTFIRSTALERAKRVLEG